MPGGSPSLQCASLYFFICTEAGVFQSIFIIWGGDVEDCGALWLSDGSGVLGVSNFAESSLLEETVAPAVKPPGIPATILSWLVSRSPPVAFD